jgi:polar amino acid transport system substrate-binding protein
MSRLSSVKPRRWLRPGVIGAVLLSLTAASCGSSSKASSSTSSPAATTATTASSTASTTAAATAGPALKIGTSADFPPLSSKSTNDSIVGFENDMLNAAVPASGHTFAWSQLDFNGLIPALQSGRLDVVTSGLYDTPARSQVVSFVDYMQIPLAVLTLKENVTKVTGPMALCGHVVAELVGSPPEADQLAQWSTQCTTAGKGAITAKTYQTVAAAVTDVSNGRAYAELEGDIVVLYISKTQLGGKLGSAFEVTGGTSTVGLAVAKNSPLLPSLTKAIKDWVASPAYCTAATKWSLTPGDLLRAFP